jgi:hypothetical protein
MIRRKSTPPPIPSYNDAVAEDRARERSDSHRRNDEEASGSGSRS